MPSTYRHQQRQQNDVRAQRQRHANAIVCDKKFVGIIFDVIAATIVDDVVSMALLMQFLLLNFTFTLEPVRLFFSHFHRLSLFLSIFVVFTLISQCVQCSVFSTLPLFTLCQVYSLNYCFFVSRDGE